MKRDVKIWPRASPQQVGPGCHRSQLSHLMLTLGEALPVVSTDQVGPYSPCLFVWEVVEAQRG